MPYLPVTIGMDSLNGFIICACWCICHDLGMVTCKTKVARTAWSSSGSGSSVQSYSNQQSGEENGGCVFHIAKKQKKTETLATTMIRHTWTQYVNLNPMEMPRSQSISKLSCQSWVAVPCTASRKQTKIRSTTQFVAAPAIAIPATSHCQLVALWKYHTYSSSPRLSVLVKQLAFSMFRIWENCPPSPERIETPTETLKNVYTYPTQLDWLRLPWWDSMSLE